MYRRPWSFGTRLIASYMALLLVAILGLGMYIFTTQTQALTEQAQQAMTGTLTQIQQNIAVPVATAMRMAHEVTNDYRLQQYLELEHSPWHSYEQTTNYFTPKMRSVLVLASHPTWLDVYHGNATLPEIYWDEVQRPPLASGTLFNLRTIERVSAEDWFHDLGVLALDEGVWRQVGTDALHGYISYLKTIYNLPRTTPLGFVRIRMAVHDVLAAVSGADLMEGLVLQVWDGHGQTLTGNVQQSAATGSGTQNAAMTVEKPIAGTQWFLQASIPYAILHRSAREARNLIFLLCAVLFATLTPIGILISHHFGRRINDVVEAMEGFQQGDFSLRLPVKTNGHSGDDELGRMARSFNHMAETIGDLINQVYVGSLRKKDAELQLLQAQINPHFLYNSLSLISRGARLGQPEHVHRLVMALAKFYRLSLNRGGMVFGLQDELDLVEAYVTVQELRGSRSFTVDYDVDVDVIGLRVMKCILQPFVENVFVHSGCLEPLYIRIAVRQSADVLTLKVIDNGYGISQEHIAQILSADGAGYGVRNVDQRLKTYYGRPFGVEIVSRLGCGTAVIIRVPSDASDTRVQPNNE